MIGRLSAVCLSVASMVFLTVAETNAADPTPAKNSVIFPNSDKLRFEVQLGQHSADVPIDQIKIGWPARVTDVDGQWLKIHDEGGYTLPGKLPATGWVRKDKVVQADAALAAYTNGIVKAQVDFATAKKSGIETKELNNTLARLYWLRGIYWETGDQKSVGSQYQLALKDYKSATDWNPSLADAWLRQGRMLVKIEEFDPCSIPAECFVCFRKAYASFQSIAKSTASAKQGCLRSHYDPTSPKNTVANSNLPWAARPSKLVLAGVDYSDHVEHIPPQFYLDLGITVEKLYKANWDRRICDDDGLFQTAKACFELAESSNPDWFRPASAQGDLFRKRVVMKLCDDPFDAVGRPKEGSRLSGEDLLNAIACYERSIRSSEKFDDALRGLAESLQLLLSARQGQLIQPTEATLCRHANLRGLFSGNTQARYAALDAAHEAAKAASFATSDRDAKNLAVRGHLELTRAYFVPANVSIEYLAQAGQTFNEAALNGGSTLEATDLFDLVLSSDAQSSSVMANLASQDDVSFRKTYLRAAQFRQIVVKLWADVEKLTPKELKVHSDLVEAIASTRRAIADMGKIAKMALSTDNEPSGMNSAQNKSAVPDKPNDPSKHVATYEDSWPSEFPIRSELVNRNARIGAWNVIFDNFERQLNRQLDSDLDADMHHKEQSRFYSDLKEWKNNSKR